MKYLKKFNNSKQQEIYIKNNYIDPAIYKIDNIVQYTNKAGNYIQDGLIFQIDGKYKGKYENILTDLISSKYICLDKNDVFTYNHNNDNIEVINTPNANLLITYDKNFEQSLNYTVEVCFEKTHTKNKFCLFITGAHSIFSPMFTVDSNHICFIQSKNNYSYEIQQNVPYTFSLNLDHGYVNTNELIITDYIDYWDDIPRNKMVFFRGISGSMNSAPFVGKLYAIRIYNRKLTQKEQLHNQEVDMIRFKIGST